MKKRYHHLLRSPSPQKRLTHGFSFFCVAVFFISGCASFKEKCKEVWGSSVAHLERARKDGRSSNFDLSADRCFEKTVKILEASGASVYLKSNDRKYLAAMNFKGYVNTTQVGVFFTKLSENSTQVEVASMIPRLTEEVAGLVFSGLKENPTKGANER
jgi:hypothetical protein